MKFKKLQNFETMFDDYNYIFSKKNFILKFNFVSIPLREKGRPTNLRILRMKMEKNLDPG